MQKMSPTKNGSVLIAVVFFSISLLFASCEQPVPESPGKLGEIITEPSNEGNHLAILQDVENCDDLLIKFQDRALEEMEQRMDRYLSEYISCGGCCYYYEDVPVPEPPLDDAPAPVNGDASSEESSDYSRTNTQVEGVDEADFIKTDGAYIYMLSNGKFQIIDAWPPEEAGIISTVDIEGIPKKLFIASDHALIYSSLDYINSTGQYPDYYYGYTDNECTYGYDCDFTGDNRKLKITVFDISDRSNPTVRRETRFSGSYINARRIGTAVHTVVLSQAISFSGLRYWPEIVDDCWNYEQEPTLEEIIAAFENLKQRNRELIQNSTITDWLPGIQDTVYTDNGTIVRENLLQDCSNFYETNRQEINSFLTILSQDIDQITELSQATILGRPGAVYASPSALYVASRQQYQDNFWWYYEDGTGPQEASTVHKFTLQSDPAGCQYTASGVVKGRVLNQFALDEYARYLRIATTTGHLTNSNVHSTLSILAEDSDTLVTVSQIDNIAPTEDIRSVRFDGHRAFVVTFKKTDPLFAFDLSDPAAPRIEGELKIPGYSTYIHFMDEEHLLTIGYDVDDQSDFAWFQGIMLQVFDVSNLTDPRLLHKEVIGTRGSSSEAATNHLAFNYFAPKDLLAIPMTICEDSSGGWDYGGEMTFSGLLIYDVTVRGGFSQLGGVSHLEPNSDDNYYACSNWWTDSNSVVKRSIFMDDYVYSVTLDQIKVNSLDNLGHDIAVITLQ